MLDRRSVLGGAGLLAVSNIVPGVGPQAFAADLDPNAVAASHPGMLVHRTQPLNAEPKLDRLRASFLTDARDFYIRSHGTLPRLDRAGYRLRVEGQVATPLDLSLDDLRSRFTERTVTAVMQCAGNRRSDLGKVKYVSGDPWGAGAISNARWTGVRLGDVLQAAGLRDDARLHVAFESHDMVEDQSKRFAFGVSIPVGKAKALETLLAWSMNGQDLPPEHGFPLRLVTPGYAGVRSPKWLAKITVQDRPSDNPIQTGQYKLYPASVERLDAPHQDGLVINDMPLNAAICEPARDSTLKAGRTTLKGYAIATARDIERVEVSIDEGRSWTQAEIERQPDAAWSWTFWSASLDLPAGRHDLLVRAWDSAGETQPDAAADVWNFQGYLCNAWHRVPVSVS